MSFHGQGFGPRYVQRTMLSLHGNIFYHRICLGRNIANASLFIDIASILWAVNISAVKDETGNSIVPNTLETLNVGAVM